VSVDDVIEFFGGETVVRWGWGLAGLAFISLTRFYWLEA